MIGGGLGAVSRYLLAGLADEGIPDAFPWGTFLVNVLGSFLIGFLYAFTSPEGRYLLGEQGRHFLMTGVLGGFTTYSSFSLQTLNLVQDGDFFRAGLNVTLTVIFCLLGCWLGILLGQTIHQGNLQA